MAVINAVYTYVMRTMHNIKIVFVFGLIISVVEAKTLEVLISNGDGEMLKVEYPQESDDGKPISDSINTSVEQLFDDLFRTNDMDILNADDILTPLINNDITDDDEPKQVSEPTTRSPDIRTTTPSNQSFVENPTKRIIVLICLSTIIPGGFMILLLWRLRKEKKRLDGLDPNGVLIYRETIIVPAYTIENTIANSTVAHMHHALYDAPPEYDTAVRTKQEIKDIHQVDSEISPPPPSYSDAVHM